jgi:hypothetical protein
LLSSGRGEAPPGLVPGGASSLRRPGCWRACRWRRAVRLAGSGAGWLPQYGGSAIRDIHHYPTQHYDHHRGQLTLDHVRDAG